jgi:hypothetical protein
VTRWKLWQRIVAEAIATQTYPEEGWGSRLEVDPDAVEWLRQTSGGRVNIVLAARPSRLQQTLAETCARRFKLRRSSGASRTIVIGPPAFCPAAGEVLCTEDVLRLKYDQGLAGLVRLYPADERLLITGFSDFGDDQLGAWLAQVKWLNG